MNTPLLNDIAFGLVKDQVIDDKMKEYEMQENQKEQLEKKEQKQGHRNQEKEEEENLELNELDEVDSEEERIMNKQINTRLEQQEKRIESEKVKLSRKYGDYRDIVETEFLDIMLKNPKVVCHFYHDQFERCKIMDKHLKQICNLHPETLFCRINADRAPFFTTKLNILPTIIMLDDGKAIDRIVGFEELGMKDDFPTINLIRRLVNAKMITALNKSEKGIMALNLKPKKLDEEDSD